MTRLAGLTCTVLTLVSCSVLSEGEKRREHLYEQPWSLEALIHNSENHYGLFSWRIEGQQVCVHQTMFDSHGQPERLAMTSIDWSIPCENDRVTSFASSVDTGSPSGVTRACAIAGTSGRPSHRSSSVEIFRESWSHPAGPLLTRIQRIELEGRVALGLGGKLDELLFVDFETGQLLAIRDSDGDGVADRVDRRPVATLPCPFFPLEAIRVVAPGKYRLRYASCFSEQDVIDDDLDGVADRVVNVLR